MSFSSLLFAGKGASMVSCFSLKYLFCFLPLCIFMYSLVPKTWKKYFLLVASCLFYWLISGKLILYLLLSVLSMHYFGLWIDRIRDKMQRQLAEIQKEEKKIVRKAYISRMRRIVILAVFIHICVLLIVKYTGFFATNLNTFLSIIKSPLVLVVPKTLMPIGISFFTLQALSYIFDVYHGVVKADENIFRLALFLCFFPQIVEGPICRYAQTAEQLWDAKPIRHDNLIMGLQRILYGMIKKIIIADRLNPLVEAVFSYYYYCEGGIIAIGVICYTIQLYMDFSGTMDVVIGTAQIFGFELPENFKQPFFSKTISEFWQRWHITLGTWFKDYLFYPITSSGRMKKLTAFARKKVGNHYGPLSAGSIALFCVWFCNGLWHGSAWNYIFFGMYHFSLILCGNLIAPLVHRINQKLHINPNHFMYRLLQVLRSVILIMIGELFFRAHGLQAGIYMFKKMITNFSFSTWNDELMMKVGIDRLDLFIVGVTLVIVFVVSIMNERGVSIRSHIMKKKMFVRWTVEIAMILFLIVFGAYGIGYAAVDPLYAQF